jgi:hypothetical protein
MISQTNWPIQYSAGLKPASSHKLEKSQDSPGVSQAQPVALQPYFQAQLSEKIVDVYDVYERSQDNIAVPDERTGVDRRQSANRKQYSPESALLQSNEKVTYIPIYPADHKINQTYTQTGNTPPAIFSPSQEKGKLIDIWI